MTAPPGAYRLPDTREFTGPLYDICDNRVLDLKDEPQILFVRVCDPGVVLQGFAPGDSVFVRQDGLQVAKFWWNRSDFGLNNFPTRPL